MQMLNKGLFTLIFLLIASVAQAATPFWQDLSGIEARGTESANLRHFRADDSALRQALRLAPHESSGNRSQQIQLPLPDGSLETYVVVESPIMEEGLAARFPEIKNYRVMDPLDFSPRGRLSISPLGLRGMLRTGDGYAYIDPENPDGGDIYLSRYRSAITKQPFRCELHGMHEPQDLSNWLGPRMRSANRVPGSIIEYRIAVAVTEEYYKGQGNNDTAVTAAVNATIDRVNEIYERDLGIRLRLITDNQELYEDRDEGLNNNSASALLAQVNAWIDTRLGPGSDDLYDIGHMFYQPVAIAGGIAFLGSVCDNAIKAGGVTGLPNPSGDPFDIDYVAHEIGHQFAAEHSFNGTTGSCGSGRWGPSAFEPGSGATIMGYAGLCGAEDLNELGILGIQGATEPTFHAGSIAEIDAFTRGADSCYQLVATSPANNSDPSVAAIPDSVIPANTPFILDGSATDPDTANLTFQWDQVDAGCPTDADSFGTDIGDNPLFRSYVPRDESWRNFPTLGTQLQGIYDRAEVLPCQDRSLNFRLTARDGNSGQDFEDMRLDVVKSAGPFEVTSLNTPGQSLPSGTSFNVTWNVAGTDVVPINCTSVDIDLMAFSDSSYSRYTMHRLATNVANTPGIFNVTLPSDANHPRTRIRVKCATSPFYALSDEDLEITGGVAMLDDDDFATRFAATPGQTSGDPPICPAWVGCGNEEPAEAEASSSGGGSSVDLWWLLALAAAVAAIRLRRA